ncbi:MAG: hypothetical protein AAGB00_04770 [Planctomycetota bacterium]
MRLPILAVAVVSFAQTAGAHFPWLIVDGEHRPRLFFGEGLTDQDYHLPDTIAKAEVWHAGIDAPNRLIPVKPHEEEGFVGLRAESGIELRGCVQTEMTYGIYHGAKLCYYAQGIASNNPTSWPKAVAAPVVDSVSEADGATSQPALRALLRVEGGQLIATLLREGEPASGVGLTLSNNQNKETVQAETNDAGEAAFPIDTLTTGLNGLMAMIVDKADSGEIDGKPYKSAMHVLTVTLNGKPAPPEGAMLAPLPEAIASFGAAAVDGYLYVYSGHIGTAHAHSKDNLSKHFRRLKINAALDGSAEWEELPIAQPLQGLAMVPHGGKLYRVGGLDARNASGDEEQLHSVDAFASFDPATKTWTALPSLPAGRSSHNATVIGDTLYVVGGWRLSGDSNGEWQAGALSFDLSDPTAEWRVLPEPPFRRRALAAGHAGGKLVVMSGMTDDAEISKAVFFYDSATRVWSEGPEFPGNAFYGFGLAAWNVGGVLYAGGMEGVVYRLSETEDAWVAAGELATPRFFHQFAPDGRGGLLAIAGASPEEGHVSSVERVVLKP